MSGVQRRFGDKVLHTDDAHYHSGPLVFPVLSRCEEPRAFRGRRDQYDAFTQIRGMYQGT